MKNIALIILVAFISISATVATNRIISQPAIPKAVFTDWYALSTSLTAAIDKYTKQGYVVKTITSNSQKNEYILVMEKY